MPNVVFKRYAWRFGDRFWNFSLEGLSMVEMYRQGDVLLMKVSALPKGAAKKAPDRRVVLAWGETSGHAHAIEGNGRRAQFRRTDRRLGVLNGLAEGNGVRPRASRQVSLFADITAKSGCGRCGLLAPHNVSLVYAF